MVPIEGKDVIFISPIDHSSLKLAQKPMFGISGFIFTLLNPQRCRKTLAPTVSRP